uniref:Uncharacterized protein n=1 Tax=Anguilla anguilla TaxID=7936 RepID=A0A0E9VIF1_ANGAN
MEGRSQLNWCLGAVKQLFRTGTGPERSEVEQYRMLQLPRLDIRLQSVVGV